MYLSVVIALCSYYILKMPANAAKENDAKFILDNDAGGDDAMAIFLSLLYEKNFSGPKLLGLTTCNGNTDEDGVCYNNQRILKVAGRQDVPIYRGSKSSLVTTPLAGDYYGVDGLGDIGDVETELVSPRTESAVNALIEHSKTYEGALTVITIGTLTNVALAIRVDPGFLGRLKHLYIAAGHIQSDKYPEPEFNAHMDVEAYHIIAQNATPEKVTVFPFSQVMETLNFTKEWRETVLGTIPTEIMTAQNKYEKISMKRNGSWAALDPAAVAMYLRPDLVQEYKYSKNDIIVCGARRGINTNVFVDKDDANVRVIYSVKTEEYRQFLLDVFKSG